MKLILGNNPQQVVEKDTIGFASLWKKEKNNPFISFILIEEAGEIIGFLFFSTIYDRIEIDQFEVLSAARKKGYGTQLLEALFYYAKEKNCKNITLEVAEDNVAAITLYQKMGFQKVALREKYYHGKDGILMEYIVK